MLKCGTNNEVDTVRVCALSKFAWEKMIPSTQRVIGALIEKPKWHHGTTYDGRYKKETYVSEGTDSNGLNRSREGDEICDGSFTKKVIF